MKKISSGAEAIIYRDKEKVVKDRVSKSYRIKEIDEKIRKLRTRAEGKIIQKLSEVINVPNIITIDEVNKKIIMDFIQGVKLSEGLDSFSLAKQKNVCSKIGKSVGKIHQIGVIHGDLTTSNMILKDNDVYFIDFGLGFQNGKYEDKAVDLHLLKQALEAKHFKNWSALFDSVKEGYLSVDKTEGKKVLERLVAVEKRGRYKH